MRFSVNLLGKILSTPPDNGNLNSDHPCVPSCLLLDGNQSSYRLVWTFHGTNFHISQPVVSAISTEGLAD
jgi:hypothetical protein